MKILNHMQQGYSRDLLSNHVCSLLYIVYVCNTLKFRHPRLTFAPFVFSGDSKLQNSTEFYFSLEPSDVVATKGEATLLNCDIHSTESPVTIQWLKDGRPLSLDRRR